MRGDLIQICLLFLFDREIIIIERGRTFLFLSTKGIWTPPKYKILLNQEKKKKEEKPGSSSLIVTALHSIHPSFLCLVFFLCSCMRCKMKMHMLQGGHFTHKLSLITHMHTHIYSFPSH